MEYNAPYGSVDLNAPYINGNPVTATPGSVIPAAGVEFDQREIINAIITAGLVPTNDDLTQLTQAIELLGRIPFVLDQGVANQIVVNPVPAVTRLTPPCYLAIKVAFNNTGVQGTTINVSGLGQVPLLRTTGATLVPSDLSAGGIIIVAFDGTEFQLLSLPGSLEFPSPQQLWHYGVDTSSTPNQIVATVDTIGTSWPTGLPVAIKVKNANDSGTVTVTLNGLAPVNLTRGTATALTNGDILSGFIALMIYDGSEAQIINPQALSASSITQIEDITGPDRPYWLAVNSISVTSPPGGPSLGDTYLIPVGATGAWSGLDGLLSQWNGASWVHRQYPIASVIGASDTLRFYENISGTTWKEIQMLTLGKLFYYVQL